MRKYLLISALSAILASCYTENNKSQTDSIQENMDTLNGVTIDKSEYYADQTDIEIYNKIISYAKEQNLKSKKLNEIEIEVARQFLNTPYVGGTLEQEGEEQLVINLHQLDCVTFMENVASISICIKSGKTDFNDYCNIIKTFRYRDGIIDGYPSRLHYTTDWLSNNQKKGLIKVVSNDFGNADFDATVYFMSKNHDKYKQLSNPDFVKRIESQENIISKTKFKFVTKEQIDKLAEHINDGDLIAISTTIPGLDLSHVGIAAYKGDKLHFFHASFTEKKVVFSDESLSKYLEGLKKNNGIIVARLVE